MVLDGVCFFFNSLEVFIVFRVRGEVDVFRFGIRYYRYIFLCALGTGLLLCFLSLSRVLFKVFVD